MKLNNKDIFSFHQNFEELNKIHSLSSEKEESQQLFQKIHNTKF